jgi:ribosome maturation protein Sdo1
VCFCSTDQERDRSVILVASENVSFQLILMFELKNMAALDGLRAKEDAALQKVFGTNFEQASKDLAAKRVEMREIYGTKVVREIALK